MKIIVGLGNPGKQYENTRHSIGFELLDLLAQKFETSFNDNKGLKCQIAKTKFNKEDVILAKPLTFMNNSGEVVEKAVSYYKAEISDVIVVCDDTYLEPGVVRIRLGGQSGGHNGLKSLISHIGEDFWRLRLGIGNNGQVPLEDYVLSKIGKDQREIISHMIDKASLEMISFISEEKFENKTIN